MTTGIFLIKKCFSCGRNGRYPEIGIISMGRPEDLDGRPGDIMRSAIYMMMQQCIYCGYCAMDITDGIDAVNTTIVEQSYKDQLMDTSYSPTTNKYLCWAMIQKKGGSYNEAGRAHLMAAWICDDDKNYAKQAHVCRNKAIELFYLAKENQQKFHEKSVDESMLLVDLLRRCSRFSEAMRLCLKTQKEKLNEDNELILMYQEELIEKKDIAKHTIYNALTR